MDTEAVRPQEASLTVNEQVIVMSSHETIRVLEVGVDAPLPVEDDGKALETAVGEVASGCPVETSEPGRGDVQPNLETACGETTGDVKPLPGVAPTSIASVTTFSQAPGQQTQAIAPLAVQTAPQYCRSSGKSAGASCVDISYSNGRCPSRTDGCFSYRGNLQTTYSQSASCCCSEHGNLSTGAARPAAAGSPGGPATALRPNTGRVPAAGLAPEPASHPAPARCRPAAARGQADRDADADSSPACGICL
uniref:POU class 6 homeobox 1 n=1 Tax=Pelusios castaneus TaxID=367368 RepID=A0A8C8VNJ4_9SAUR